MLLSLLSSGKEILCQILHLTGVSDNFTLQQMI